MCVCILFSSHSFLVCVCVCVIFSSQFISRSCCGVCVCHCCHVVVVMWFVLRDTVYVCLFFVKKNGILFRYIGYAEVPSPGEGA